MLDNLAAPVEKIGPRRYPLFHTIKRILGFLLGPEAFSSGSELNQTVLHELYRLNFSEAAGEFSGELVTQETNAAASFARAAGQLP
jgi:hypothetical protein